MIDLVIIFIISMAFAYLLASFILNPELYGYPAKIMLAVGFGLVITGSYYFFFRGREEQSSTNLIETDNGYVSGRWTEKISDFRGPNGLIPQIDTNNVINAQQQVGGNIEKNGNVDSFDDNTFHLFAKYNRIKPPDMDVHIDLLKLY